MKRFKNFLAIMLIVSMVLTTNGAYVLAEGVESTIKTESNIAHKNYGESESVSLDDDTSSFFNEKDNVNGDGNSLIVESDESKDPSISNDDESKNSKGENDKENDNNESSAESESIESSFTNEESSSKKESDDKINETKSTTNEESTDESSNVTTTIITTEESTTIKKEIVEEDNVATLSEIENVEDNKTSGEKKLVELKSTKSEIVNDLYGEEIATNSETSTPIDEIEHYSLGNRDDGFVAPAVDRSKLLFGANLPTKWDSREQINSTTGLSWVSPIRDQGGYGICWAFATACMFETSLRKKGLVTTEEEANLSELALAFFHWSLKDYTNKGFVGKPGAQGHDYTAIGVDAYEDDPSTLYHDESKDATWSQCGGNQNLSTRMLTAYMGMVVEDDVTAFTNTAKANAEAIGLPGKYAFDENGYIIKDVKYINKADKDLIKQAIMDNGSVGFSYCAFVNDWQNALAFHRDSNNDSYFFTNGQTGQNHAIAMVGWDDSVSPQNFYYGNSYAAATYKASNPGAWLCRNSWGNNSKLKDGYFWISYDETSLSNVFFTIDAIKADTYKYNYHYDTTCFSGGGSPYGVYTTFGNVYKVDGEDDNQILEAVNIGVGSANSTFDVKIYTNSNKMNDPTDGVLKSTQRCSNDLAGFYTYELDNKVELTKGSYYSIVVEQISTSGDPVILYVDSNIMETTTWYNCYNEIERGQSFYKPNVSYYDWQDMYDDGVTTVGGENFGDTWRIKGLANSSLKITFDSDGGEGTMTAQAMESGVPTKIKLNTFKKAGYRFKNWINPVTGDEYENGEEISITRPITLKVVWEEVRYTLGKNWYNENVSGMSKTNITSIRIMMYPEASPSNVDAVWNIVGSDGLIASRKGTDVYIYGPDTSITGTIDLPADSSYLFSGDFVKVNYLDNEHMTDRDSMLLGPNPAPGSDASTFESLVSITGIDLLNTDNVTDMQGMFMGCTMLETIDLSSFNTSNVTDMSLMFANSFNDIEYLDLSSFNTSNVTSFNQMFNTSGIKEINVSSFDTSSAINMGGMFCMMDHPTLTGLQKLDLSNFDTSNVKIMMHMISAYNLATVSVTSFDTRNVTTFEGLFYDMRLLTEIDISSFDTTSATDMRWMFADCANLVKIMASNAFVAKGVTTNMFDRCTSLKGGKDTAYTDSNPKDGTYARIDGKNGLPGYFTSVGSVTVTFDYSGKGVNYSETYEKGENITKPTNPTYTGYTFIHWYKDGTSDTTPFNFNNPIGQTSAATIRLIAKWTANEYQVNYNLSGISATAPSTPITKKYGTALATGDLKNPTNIPTGYTFAGWYKEATFINEWTGTDDLTTGTTAQTIYARWKAKITYNANGHGTAPSAVDVYLNATTVLPSITNVTGYTFDATNSWYGEAGCTTLIGASGSNYTVTAPKELFAKWNEEEYTITYDRKDGNWVGTAPAGTRKYSTEVTLPTSADITKNDGTNDYVFKGWYTEDGSASTWDETKKVTKINANTVAPTGGHKFYARWNPAWKITFNMLSHGTTPTDIIAEQGTKVPTADVPANPTETGYIFSGWYKNYNAGAATFDDKYTNPFNFSTDTVTSNMTLYAKWKPITYTISYNANGGTVSPTSDTKTYDANLTLAVPTRTGYDFDAWYQNYNSTTKTFTNPYDGTTNISTTNGDTKTIYAKWIPHQYTVNYDLVGVAGAVAPTSTITKTYGEPLAAGVLKNPSVIPSGYEFLGWFRSYDSTTGTYGTEWTGADDLTTGTTAQTIYAKWKRAIVYNVLKNGVDIGAVAVPSKEITGETTYQLPNATATGYTFGGWYREAECTNFVGTYNDDVTVSAPTTLYAKWTPISYKIYYKNVDGSSITDGEYVTKTYGSTVTLNTTPTKTGYVFNGWYKDNTSFNNSYDGTSDLASTQDDDKNIYAKWTANEYQVNYDLSGISATAPSTPITKKYGTALATGDLKNPTNIPTGYTFAGWYKESTFVNEWTGTDDLTTGTTAQTIYARWKAKITYNANGHGTAPSAVDVYLNATTVLPSITNVTGYTFDTTNSWYGEAGCTTLIGASGSNYTVTAPKELFAKWNEEEYTITYDRKDGNWVGTAPASSRKYSEEITLPVATDIAKNDGVNDYIFKGWYTVDGSTTTWDETKKVTKINANTVAPTGGHKFYARWNPAWKITFNMLSHGTAPTDIVAEQGTKVPTADVPANPTETGYIFSGWYKNYDSTVADFDSRYTNPFNFNTDTVTANMTLYAKWKPITYTISYNANGGIVSPTSDTKTYDANLTLAVPTRTGYDFDAWYQNYNSTTKTFTNPYDGTTNISTTNGDTKTIYAKWIPHQYTVNYDLVGVAGAVAPTSTITKTYGEPLADGVLQNPSVIPSGYEFLGWFRSYDSTTGTYGTEWTGADDLTTGTTTQTIYAKWKTAVVFSVLYQGNDIGATVPTSIEITGPTDINLPSTTAPGYTFGGWYSSATDFSDTNRVGGAGEPVNVSVPTTFYAKWTPTKYNITYNTLGGTLPSGTQNPFEKTYGSTVTLTNPTYEGYDFGGWYANYNSTTKAYSSPFNGSTDISTDGTGKTIYAKWNPHKYNIKYELSGHATAMTPYEKTYGTSYTPPTPTGIASGYKFDGWFKESTFTTAYTGDDLTTGTDAQTIYARWKATITYDANGHGTAPASVDVILGQTTMLPSIANVTGWTFDTTNSWYGEAGCTTLIGASGSNYTVNAPKKLYARWNENEYTITYNKDDGNWATGYDPVVAQVTSRKYTQEKVLPVSANIVKTGYTFLGWYKQGDTTKTVISKINANTDGSVTVVAKWSENTYSITLNRNGGNYVSGYTAPTTRKYTESKTLPTNANIKKTGHVLEGWHGQSNFSDAAVTEVAANTAEHKTFYAKWVPETYAVTLTTNGGTINSGDVNEYTYGIGATLPTDVTKANNVFKGWWTLDGTTSGNWGTQVRSISATDTGVKTYYAKWAESFIVTFNLTTGTAPDEANITNKPVSQNIESGGTAIRPIVNPQAADFEFLGWYDSTLTNEFNFSSPITANTTIYAKWNSAETYEVTFNLLSGTTHPTALTNITNVPEIQHIVNGGKVTKPNDPSSTGYKFIGWYTSDTFTTEWKFTTDTIIMPKTIYGKWELQNYNITYVKNDGEWVSGFTPKTERKYGETVTLPTADNINKKGFTFAGWFEDSDFINPIASIDANYTDDKIVYASWTRLANTKIITFNDNYSGATAEQAFILGESTEIKTDVFKREGYTFIRWKDVSGKVYLNTNQLTGDIVLYAEWQENPKPTPNPTPDPAPTPAPTERRPRSDDSGSSSSSSSGGGRSSSGPIPQSQLQQQQQTNVQGTAKQVEVSTSKSEQVVVNGATSQWQYDPVNNSWKLAALDLMGVPTVAANGFYILNQVTVELVNNIYVPKTVQDTYYFDAAGNMVTGWVKTNDNKWYFFNNEKTLDEGKLCIGWKLVDGSWYFFSSNDGSMLTNTTTSDGYKIGSDGKWIQ